ncbi:MAG: HAD family hydrolase [Sphingomonadaceae bacterium]|nr:HAD family hydrolase [Sphingomonadaceae bacterium]
MTSAVRATEIARLLADAPSGLRYLSLDCFDTLLWRNAQMPRDVFADLGIAGGGIEPRTWAEGAARRAHHFEAETSEVSIEQIYARLLPAAGDEARAEAVARELAAEARHCYAFAPTVELMRDAKRRGLRIVIVSDTYLSEPQLWALIAAAAGDEVVQLIDRIFCSSHYGRSKGDGLFEDVIAELRVLPATILHLGDNEIADLKAPLARGVRAVHFRQFDAAAEHRLRLEAAAAAFVDPSVRTTAPAFQPQRPAVSLREADDSAWVLGHDVMGPMMHAFARWLESEADALAERYGRTPKPVFLLRDGHLPARAYAALGHEAAAIELSRFTATAASFTDEAAIRDYLGGEGGAHRVDVMARQLLFSEGEAAKLVKAGGPTGSDESRFKQAVLAPEAIQRIVTRSGRFAERLIAHLRGKAGVERGDTIILVDLGYNGTVQNMIEPVLRARLGVEVAGRYLLLREQNMPGFDKAGLLDVRHYDTKALIALSESIAVVEQLCTLAQGSVIDYSEKGQPIRKAAGVKSAQSAVRDRVQEAALAFVAHAGIGVHRPAVSDDADARRRMSAAILARLLFLPSESEIALLESFDHDVNLGTKDLTRLLDVEASGDGLRRRGLPYLHDSARMYLSAELKAHGLPLSLTFLAQRRFGLELRHSDFQTRPLKLPVMIADAQSQTIAEIDAHPTHDGYYLATVPVGASRYSLGVQWGRLCEWVQVEEASFHAVTEFNRIGGREVAATPLFRGMEPAAGGLYRCDPSGFMFVTPPAQKAGSETALLLAIVFRPVVPRAGIAVAQAA